MLETEEFAENQNGSQPKSYVMAGLTILIVGIASGAIYRYSEFRKSPNEESVQGTIEEEQKEEIDSSSPTSTAPSGQDVEVKQEQASEDPSPPPAVGSRGTLPSKGESNKVGTSPAPLAPKIDVCEVQEKQRVQKYQQADTEYSTAHSAARQTFDAEQLQYETSLAALSRQRNDAINKYLTAIALATSKYNSSTEPNAYEIYQQDQSAALTAYTEAVARINIEEGPILAAKKDSQTKYDAAVAAALAKRDMDKAAADAEYSKAVADKC